MAQSGLLHTQNRGHSSVHPKPQRWGGSDSTHSPSHARELPEKWEILLQKGGGGQGGEMAHKVQTPRTHIKLESL